MDTKPQLRLKDIAVMAGVSTSTVSRALRGEQTIPKATRTRIAAIARKAGYRRDPLVAALMSRVRAAHPTTARPGIAFVFLHDAPQGPTGIMQEYWDGAKARCEALGFVLQDFCPVRDRMPIPRLAEVLRARGISGVIVGPKSSYSHLSDECLRPLWKGFSVALLGYSIRSVQLYRAENHLFFTIFLGLNKLRGLGYRRPALVTSRAVDLARGCQLSGAAEAFRLQPQGKGCRKSLLLPAMERDLFFRWFEREKPDALLIAGHTEFEAWIKEAGWNIPRDIACASFRVTPKGGHAGIDQKTREVAASAVDLVIEQLHRNEYGIPPHPKEVLIEGEWVDGPTAPGLPGGGREK